MERVARFADYENEAIETPRRKRGAAAVIYDINININMYRYVCVLVCKFTYYM